MIRIALPSKGRLAEPTLRILEQAGLPVHRRGPRSLQACLGDRFQALFLRAGDVPRFVAEGAVELGITGRDRVAESGCPVEELLDLDFGHCRLVVAARAGRSPDDLAQLPPGTRVATAFPRLTERFFRAAGARVTVIPVSGATEIAPYLGMAELIVDLVASGSTLRVHGLCEVATLMESTAVLVARPGARCGSELSGEIDLLVESLASVLQAKGMRYLMANVPRERLAEVRRLLPGLAGPTIVDLDGERGWLAAHAVVAQERTYEIVARLKALGACGILVTSIERLAP